MDAPLTLQRIGSNKMMAQREDDEVRMLKIEAKLRESVRTAQDIRWLLSRVRLLWRCIEGEEEPE